MVTSNFFNRSYLNNTDASQVTPASNFTDVSKTYSAQEKHQCSTLSCFQYAGLGDTQE